MNNKEYTQAVENKEYPNTPVVPIDHKYEDERGVINNLLHTPITSIARLTSKAGTERANHWHKYNAHYTYVVSGEIEYWERPLDGDAQPQKWTFKAGEMFYTRPRVIHKMVFHVDTVFLTFAPELKDHDSYEDDVVRVKF